MEKVIPAYIYLDENKVPALTTCSDVPPNNISKIVHMTRDTINTLMDSPWTLETAIPYKGIVEKLRKRDLERVINNINDEL